MAAFYPLCRFYRPGNLAVIRITELPMPLDYAPEALRRAILARLAITEVELVDFTLFKRSHDARKKTAIVLIYTVDCELATPADEAAVLARFSADLEWRKGQGFGFVCSDGHLLLLRCQDCLHWVHVPQPRWMKSCP